MAMNKAKTGVLLVNLGTPDSTETSDVRKYLREFLMDPRVIDIPFLSRWMLINFIIAPFRAPKSAHEYRKLWTDRGSPLLFHTVDLREKLTEKLDPKKYVVSIGMRYEHDDTNDNLQLWRNAGQFATVSGIPPTITGPNGTAAAERPLNAVARSAATQQRGLSSGFR